MPAHKHENLMAQYAQDALQSATPWELWEFKYDFCAYWGACPGNPSWDNDAQYRRKPAALWGLQRGGAMSDAVELDHLRGDLQEAARVALWGSK